MTRRPKALVGAALLAVLVSTPADARQKNDSYSQRLYDQHSVGAPIYSPQYQERLYPGPGNYHKKKTAKKYKGQHRALTAAARRASMTGVYRSAQILPHPAGCPPRAFCGCGVALRLLGKPVRAGGLAIAANWTGFPRTSCAPGMAAARRGHVFAIEQCLPGNMALAYDPNSGQRLTRLHVRSLSGYAIVNPHGAYTEVNGKPGRSYRAQRHVRYAKRYKRRYAAAG